MNTTRAAEVNRHLKALKALAVGPEQNLCADRLAEAFEREKAKAGGVSAQDADEPPAPPPPPPGSDGASGGGGPGKDPQ